MRIFSARSFFTFAAALVLCASAQAGEELRDRYIEASKSMGEGMLEVLQDCAPDVDMSGINFDYTPRMTEAVGCLIDTHIDRLGRDKTVELVEAAEEMGERSFSTMQEMASMQEDYPVLSSPAMVEISQECGTIEASKDLPLSQLMQENMADFMGCFSQ